ncbi:uncharacterized protein TRAVEDRAFT_42252 [Trametes versicolor FP-101664 SS1]|uniref:uncharacterized protein n=1 Tax=Trametes versicolor (strain FP-101664) TaxID=717944 RepID=UPI0004622B45|nr:uncharacterized protein TRAVEDRAFT_42252 [Trametes versicolor FP-101664 SS1]EIW64839.1 hypothetical protein TRAVEDRAFT_42252 [Trametes versicolor FP-101664 SS1]
MAVEFLPTISASLGPLLIGVIMASCMYGVTTVQTYIYFERNSAADKTSMKYLVFSLWMLNTLRMAIVSNAAYTYMVTDFMNPVAICKPTWAIFPSAVVTVGASNAVVRCVFCYRVWRLSGNNFWLALPITLTIFASLGTNLAYSVIALFEYEWLLSWAFACSMAADILICASLCILLARRRTGFATSDTIVRKLTIYAVNTGLLSTICALLCLTTYLTMPDNFIFMALYIIYPELILNALLATFNGRTSLKKNTASAIVAQQESAQKCRGTHAMGQVKDINVVELGALTSSTSQGSDICVVEQVNEAHKVPQLHAWAT